MIIGNQVKEKLMTIPEGIVFTISDFGFGPDGGMALAKALGRMVSAGTLCRFSKGKYYKPKQTMLGAIEPSGYEIMKDLLVKDGRMVGYITGVQAFASMGLTSQISSSILIGTGKYRRPLTRGEYKISFLKQNNVITEDNVELLRILDAVKLIRDIPAVTPDEACRNIISIIRSLPDGRIAELEELSLAYTSYVRAVTGAILEYLGRSATAVRASLNGTSSYKLPISEEVLPNKSNWNIYGRL